MTVPDWMVERYALGELDDDDRALVEADPRLDERMAALERSDAEILRAYDAHRVAAVAGSHRPARRPRWGLVVAMAVAVVLVGVGRRGRSDGHRAKGGLGPELRVFRQGPAGEAQSLTSGDTASEGDVLQVQVVRGDVPHGWVISVDGRGHVTVHHGGELAPGAHVLPDAYALDDAPRYEHFFVVSCEEPLSRDAVLAGVRVGLDRATLDVGCGQQHDVWVRKP